MGNLEEAATLFEKASGLNPEVWASTSIPAATYGLLGREKEARAALDNYKKGWSVEPQLPQIMFYFPFKDRSVADRFAEGLIKAGLPPGKVSGGYFPAFKENQLAGEEIKRLTYGSKLTGIGFNNQQWWMDKRRMENSLGVEQDQFLPIRVRAGLRAIWSACSFKRYIGDLNIA